MNRFSRLLLTTTFEACLAAFPLLVLFQLPFSVGLLWMTVALGLLVERGLRRFEPPALLERLLLVLGAAVTASLWLMLLSGTFTPAALTPVLPGRNFSWPHYAALLGALVTFLRGTRVASAPRDSRVTAVWWGGALAAASLILSAGLNAVQHPAAVFLTMLLPVLMLLQLVEPSSAAAAASADTRRRSILMTVAVAALTLPIGLLAALFADGAVLRTAAADGLRLLLVPIALAGSLLAEFINRYVAGPFAALFDMLNIRLRMTSMPVGESDAQLFAPLADALEHSTSSVAADAFLALLVLLPVVLAVTLLVLLRRRRHRAEDETEEVRRSLGVADNLSQDLRDLWQRLRRRRTPGGLEAALAALAGRRPAFRVRRALVQVLLQLEARRLARRPAETLSAFTARVALAIPALAAPLSTLTAHYLPARYADQADEAAATAAEQARAAAEAVLNTRP